MPLLTRFLELDGTSKEGEKLTENTLVLLSILLDGGTLLELSLLSLHLKSFFLTWSRLNRLIWIQDEESSMGMVFSRLA